MIQVFLALWVVSAALIIIEKKIVRIIIYLGIFSMFASVCFLLLSAPDVAMAEAVISVFSTVFFIICFEKYYGLCAKIPEGDIIGKIRGTGKIKNAVKKAAPPLIFTAALFALFICFIPDTAPVKDLPKQYLGLFKTDIGGENAVTAVYLGYRVYDTLFEALMLLVSVVAVAHLSWYNETSASSGRQSDINRSEIAVCTIRVIAPLILLFSVYLIANGHLSPGGGFQGGVMAAAFFICRYLIHNIYDVTVKKIITAEKLLFVCIALFAALFIFMGLSGFFSLDKSVYLIAMNLLIGLKVACGFMVIFYRFIVFEKK